MPVTSNFKETIENGYSFKGEHFIIGSAMVEGELQTGVHVQVPLKTMNRHGLIAGATGTGKTKTLQLIAESLSDASVPVLMMDIKGDLSGIAAKGSLNDKIKDRMSKMAMDYNPSAFPVELMSLSSEKGVRLRSTVIEFGPILMSRVLNLNDTLK